MKTLLAIPSKGRADILRENTLRWLEHCALDWKVFLEPQEVEEYGLPPDRVIVLAESNQGLGFSKQTMREYAEANGYDAIFKIDDDIRGWSDFRKKTTPEESAALVEKTVLEFQGIMYANPDVVGLSFPYAFQMFERFEYRKTKRVQTAYLFLTKHFYIDRSFQDFEDFAVGLVAIVKGKRVLASGKVGIDLGVPVGGKKSFHRTPETAMRACELLRKIYPPLKLRKVSKPWEIEPDLRSIKIGYYL